jgi:hypothetical protein
LNRFEQSNAKENLKINCKQDAGVESFKRIAPVLEGIVQGIEGKTAEQVISEFYIGAFGIWGDMEFWPKAIEKFYGQLNYKLRNPESFVCEENREKMIKGAIKNKWLSTTGVSFKGRYERLKLLGEKNIREDGTKIGTKAIEFRSKGKIKVRFEKYVEKKDYKVPGIETNGVAKKYKIDKDGKKQFICYLK